MVTSKKKISVYLDKQLKADLEALAKLRVRSLNNLIEAICVAEVNTARAEGELDESGKNQNWIIGN